MATVITSYNAAANSLSGIACQVGDLLLFYFYRDGSNTAPSLPSDLINLATGGANSNSERTAYKYATSTSESCQAAVNANMSMCIVIRNGAPGLSAAGGNSNTTFSYSALTLYRRDNTSFAIAFVGTRDGTNGTNPQVQTAPTGMSNVNSLKNATCAIGAHQTSSTITSWSTQTVNTGVASTGWRTRVIEIIDITSPGALYKGYFNPDNAGTLFSTFLQLANVLLTVRFTMDSDWIFNGSSHKIEFLAWANSVTPITMKGVVLKYNSGTTNLDKVVETSGQSVDDTVGSKRTFILPSASGSNGDILHLGMFGSADYNMLFFNPSLVNDSEETQSAVSTLTYPTVPASIADSDLSKNPVSCMIWITYGTPAGTVKKRLLITGVGK